MGNLVNKLKIWIKEKSKATVFGDAYGAFNNLYEKNHVAFFIEILASILISILISGYFMLILMNLLGENYSMSLWNCFAAWISKGGFILSIVMFAVVQVMIGRFIRVFSIRYRRDDKRNINVSSEGTYGTAKEMDRETMANTFVMDTLKNNKGTIFGRDPENPNIMVAQKHPLRKINRNCIMIAGPSAGKSACFVIPLLFQIIRRGESAIISDPKSELFAIVSEVAKRCGYEVRIINLNPMFLENSDPCNFLMYVGDDIDKAQVMSTAIITNTTGVGDLADFWTEGAINLLQFIMLYINVGSTFKKSQKNLPMIFTWLVENSMEDIDSVIENLPDDHPAKAPGMIFMGGDPKVKQQTLQGLRIKLKLFNSPKLRKILSETDGGLDILNPGRKKCLYFVGSNDQDSSMAPIVSLFYTLLYQELVRYADERSDRELPVTVHMVLDEYANMGTIPDFEKKLSTVRSRGIVTYIILQDINQLKAKHPNDTWRTVINDCDYYLLMKTNDTETMKWWVEMGGKMTVNVQNINHEKWKSDAIDIHNEEKVTDGQGARDVYTGHEIRTLGNDDILVLVSQRDITMLKTFFWKEHPYAKAVQEVQPSQHYPLWRLKADGIVGEDFDYDNEPTIVMEIKEDEMVEKDNSYDPDSILKVFGKKKKKGETGLETVMDRVKSNTLTQKVKEKGDQWSNTRDEMKRKITGKIRKPVTQNKEEEEEEDFKPKLTVVNASGDVVSGEKPKCSEPPLKAEKKPEPEEATAPPPRKKPQGKQPVHKPLNIFESEEDDASAEMPRKEDKRAEKPRQEQKKESESKPEPKNTGTGNFEDIFSEFDGADDLDNW